MPVNRVEDIQEENDAGELVNLYQITYTVPDRPGQWVFTVPKTGDPVAAAAAEIAKITDEINRLYGLG